MIVKPENTISTNPFVLYVGLFFTLLLHLLLVLKLEETALPVIGALLILIATIIIYNNHIRHLPTFLIILYLLPLIYLNNYFHYALILKILTFLPLFIFIFIALFNFVSNEHTLELNNRYLALPLVLILIYFTLIGIIEFFRGANWFWISDQLFHIYLYILTIPFLYLLNKREHYIKVFYALIFIFFLISLEYIVLNKLLLNFRFVTFQSSFFPIITGLLTALYLLSESSRKKILWLFLLFVSLGGAFVTLTRTLWVAVFISIIVVLLLYWKEKNRLTKPKWFLIGFILIAPLVIISDSGKKASVSETNQLDYRTKSVANPLEDNSFLMRIELAYYAFQHFSESPVFGSGLSDYLMYKILVISNDKNYYIDNSWLYFLWKGGIIGFTLFAILYFRIFRRSITVLKNSGDDRTKMFIIGLIGGFAGMVFLGLFGPALIKYKATVLIALAIAYIEFEANKIDINYKQTLNP